MSDDIPIIEDFSNSIKIPLNPDLSCRVDVAQGIGGAVEVGVEGVYLTARSSGLNNIGPHKSCIAIRSFGAPSLPLLGLINNFGNIFITHLLSHFFI